MSIILRLVCALLVLPLGMTACGGAEIIDLGSQGAATSTATAPPASEGPAAPTTPEGTTTTVFTRLEDVTLEPPSSERVSIVTEDGAELHAELWEDGDVAVLSAHDFDNPTAGAFGQRPEQDAASIQVWNGLMARIGFTVLTFEWRGHGESGGEFAPPDSRLDLPAAYQYLVDQGHETIVMFGFVGAGTAAAAIDGEREDVNFDGIAMLFSPPQDHGLDADAALPTLEASVWFVATNAGSSASWARRMEAKTLNSAGVYVFERTPTGLQFLDVFGSELGGRLLRFIESYE